MTRKTLPQCAAQKFESHYLIICRFLKIFIFFSFSFTTVTIETSVAPWAQVPSAALEIIELEKSRSSQLTVPQAHNVLIRSITWTRDVLSLMDVIDLDCPGPSSWRRDILEALVEEGHAQLLVTLCVEVWLAESASMCFDKSGLFVFTVEVYDALYPSLWAQSEMPRRFSLGRNFAASLRIWFIFDSNRRRNHLHDLMPVGNLKDNSQWDMFCFELIWLGLTCSEVW